MAEPTFQVAFDGQLVAGADPEQVKSSLARLFKIDVTRVEPLFSGQRAVVKRDLDAATAEKYRLAFERAGAVAIVLDASGQALPAPAAITTPPAPPPAEVTAPPAPPPAEVTPPPAPPPAEVTAPPAPPPAEVTAPPAPPPAEVTAPPAPSPAAPPATAPPPAAASRAGARAGDDAGPSRVELAEAGRAPPPMVARGATPSAPADMTMADAGAMLIDEPTAVQAPEIDTSHLTLSEPGVDLVEHEKAAPPEFDLSAFELAPPGTPLTDDR